MAKGEGSGGMSLGMKFIRLLIFLFNIVFFLIGVALLAIGIYVMVDPKLQTVGHTFNFDYTNDRIQQGLSYIQIFAVTLIVIGSFLVLVGFLGCCGAIKSFKFMHVLYATIIGIIIVAEIGITIYFVSFQSKFKEQLIPKLQLLINNTYAGPPITPGSNPGAVSLSWDLIQYNMKCCGAVSKTDFNSATVWNRTNPYNSSLPQFTYPLTCCPIVAQGSWNELPLDQLRQAERCATYDQGSVYTQGCYDKLMTLIATYKNSVIIGAVVILVVELLAFIFAISLYRRKADYNTL
ncbi:unnamed protein product [Didymodactylos carnosus]|uniref:Tetraspanin n=1 Tax=Didymodactylos carnosus TaxID=1234261 RepID=A0A814IA50_9BILA|nr:unnamed protein product [Didymodactylos carnosus]CAF1195218.1 unnamed protein product [Didymodactylos carnosus]CAF3792597.1 unnamed protein product [Didymodactylos carnosus]CAF4005495.1 unnamed protein product [Didymodactylos carnosus]